jgi:cullin 3
MQGSGVVDLLSMEKIEDLARMYSLFSRVDNGLPQLRTTVKEFVLVLGRDLNRTNQTSPIASPKDSTESSTTSTLNWVEEMIAIKSRFDHLLKEAFQGDTLFETDINSAIHATINDHPKSAELVSLFIDENLRKGLKGVSICGVVILVSNEMVFTEIG